MTMGDKTLSHKFQSTLPRGERLDSAIYPQDWISYFNPRSHEGSDPHPRSHCVPNTISIHAPTRGATMALIDAITHCFISIHAPTRGATFSSSVIFTFISISIHAPTRGATKSRSCFYPDYRISIHAPTRGATRCSDLILMYG